MKPRLPIILLMLPLLLSSCFKKSGTTTVEGTAIDMYSKKGIPNAEVFLHTLSGSSGTGYSSKEITRADEYGNFNFSFEASKNATYEVVAGVFDRYKPKSNDGVNIRKGRKNKDLMVECRPVGWVRVNIVNTEPKDSLYLLEILGLWKPNSFEMSLTDRDTSFIGLALQGGDTLRLGVWVYPQHGGNSDWRSVRLFLPPLDTTEITINY